MYICNSKIVKLHKKNTFQFGTLASKQNRKYWKLQLEIRVILPVFIFIKMGHPGIFLLLIPQGTRRATCSRLESGFHYALEGQEGKVGLVGTAVPTRASPLLNRSVEATF